MYPLFGDITLSGSVVASLDGDWRIAAGILGFNPPVTAI
jgi:hypothetical protein